MMCTISFLLFLYLYETSQPLPQNRSFIRVNREKFNETKSRRLSDNLKKDDFIPRKKLLMTNEDIIVMNWTEFDSYSKKLTYKPLKTISRSKPTPMESLELLLLFSFTGTMMYFT